MQNNNRKDSKIICIGLDGVGKSYLLESLKE